MEAIALIWNEVIIRPMVNSLVFLYVVLFNNFGLAIVFFTIIIRLLTTPLTLRQIRQTRKITSLQPKLKEIQEKYAKDRQRLSRETMSLYRQAGINPIGCLGPFVIQMPIWIGLFQALRQTLPTTPDTMVSLSEKLYSWLPMVHTAVPLSNKFLWLNLAEPDALILPVLVGVSTWVQQKMMTAPSADPRQASTNNIMLWMMPIMLAFFAFTFPSGLALYWVVSNAVGVVTQYFITGWGPLFARTPAAPTTPTQEGDTQLQASDTQQNPDKPGEEKKEDGNERGFRKDRGRGGRGGSKGARRKARRS